MSRTIEDLLMVYERTEREDWHKHPNGGGWVFKTAIIDKSAYIGPNAIILDRACVRSNARIEDFARVSHQAVVGDNAVVRDHARIRHDACIYDDTVIFGDAIIEGNACIADTAAIGGNARIAVGRINKGTKKTTPIQVLGTHFPMGQSAPGIFKIGCEEHTWAKWDKHLERIAKNNGVSPKQYRAIFNAMNSLRRGKRKSDG